MKLKKLLVVLLVVLTSAFTLAGCDDSNDGGLQLTDYHVAINTSFVDAFGMNSAEDLFYKFDDADKTISFAGAISDSPDFAQESLIFAVQITESGSWNKTVGKFIAVSIKDNNGSTSKMSTAFSVAADAKNECDTAVEALSVQTVEDGYFGFYGDYQKQ